MASSDQMTHASPAAAEVSLLSHPASGISWRYWGLWLAGFGLFSMIIPRDASFDVVHYHLHNGWAAMNGRDGHDLAPAELHSFLNPTWQIFIWGLVDLLPGRLVAFILGAMQGLILPALYALTRRTLALAGAKPSTATVIAIAVAGFLAEAQFGLFGSVRNDAICALVFITGLVMLVPDTGKPPSLKTLGLASLMMGALMGMKLTNSVYVAGFAAAALIVMPDWSQRAKAMLVCALAGFAGILLLGGPWAWHMYQTYGNPLFPMMNGYFDAPLGPDTAFRDGRYLPSGPLEAIIRPFLFLFDGELVNEHHFFDLRFLLTYLGGFAVLAFALVPRLRAASGKMRPLIALSVGALAAIFAWMLLFSISRYMSAAWMIGPTMLALVIALYRPQLFSHQRAPLAVIGAAALLFMTTQPSELRRVPWTGWTQNYVTVDLPDTDFSNSLVIFSGGYPGAFMAPAFPKTTRFTHAVPQVWSAPALDNYRPLIRDLITRADYDLHVVIVDTETHFEETLGRLKTEENLSVTTSECRVIATSFSSPDAKWKICPARYQP